MLSRRLLASVTASLAAALALAACGSPTYTSHPLAGGGGGTPAAAGTDTPTATPTATPSPTPSATPSPSPTATAAAPSLSTAPVPVTPDCDIANFTGVTISPSASGSAMGKTAVQVELVNGGSKCLIKQSGSGMSGYPHVVQLIDGNGHPYPCGQSTSAFDPAVPQQNLTVNGGAHVYFQLQYSNGTGYTPLPSSPTPYPSVGSMILALPGAVGGQQKTFPMSAQIQPYGNTFWVSAMSLGPV